MFFPLAIVQISPGNFFEQKHWPDFSSDQNFVKFLFLFYFSLINYINCNIFSEWECPENNILERSILLKKIVIPSTPRMGRSVPPAGAKSLKIEHFQKNFSQNLEKEYFLSVLTVQSLCFVTPAQQSTYKWNEIAEFLFFANSEFSDRSQIFSSKIWWLGSPAFHTVILPQSSILPSWNKRVQFCHQGVCLDTTLPHSNSQGIHNRAGKWGGGGGTDQW